MKIYMGDDTTLETISIIGDVEINMLVGMKLLMAFSRMPCMFPRLLKSSFKMGTSFRNLFQVGEFFQ
jgi:hypothetical protein